MKRNLDAEFLSLDGVPIEDGDGDKKRTLTIKTLIVNALLSPSSERDLPSGEEKARRFTLALRINKGGEQDFTPEDLALIKRLVGLHQPPLAVGQVYRWADE